MAEFAAGQTTASIDIPVTADSRMEPDETFRLRLSKPINLWPATGTVAATVFDAVLSGAPQPRQRGPFAPHAAKGAS